MPPTFTQAILLLVKPKYLLGDRRPRQENRIATFLSVPATAALGQVPRMANLSEDDRKIIEKYPLKNSLAHLQDSLSGAEKSYEIAGDGPGQGAQAAVSILLQALMPQQSSYNLRSECGNRDLCSELYTVVRRIQKGDLSSKKHQASRSGTVYSTDPSHKRYFFFRRPPHHAFLRFAARQ